MFDRLEAAGTQAATLGRPVGSARAAAFLVLGLSVLVGACSGTQSASAPASPTSVLRSGDAQTDHTLPGGGQIRSFDTATCNTVTSTFASGTEVCAKATGLGNGFTGYIRWFAPGADVNNTSAATRTTTLSSVNGSYQDRYTPLACGTWTLKLYHSDGGQEVFSWTFTVTGCTFEACSPGYWKNHPSAYTDATFESVFATGHVSSAWMLSDALDYPGGTSSEPNPFNANFVGTGAYLSAIHPSVNYPYTSAFVIDAVQDAHNGDPTGINLLAATFAPGHVCPLN